LKALKDKKLPRIVFSTTATTEAKTKAECFDAGAILVTNNFEELENALE
jgi:hypothetical protein